MSHQTIRRLGKKPWTLARIRDLELLREYVEAWGDTIILGSGIYSGDGTVGIGRVVTLTDTINFTGGNFGIGTIPTRKLHVQDCCVALQPVAQFYNKHKDVLAQALLLFSLDNSNDIETVYGGISGEIADPTAGVEDGNLKLFTVNAGVINEWMTIFSDGATNIDTSLIIGNNIINSSAILECQSTTQGFLPPYMTGAEVEGIVTPADGLQVYATNAGSGDVTGAGWYGYITGSGWLPLIEESIGFACSDELTVLTIGTGKVVFRLPYSILLTDLRASLTTAGTTSGVTEIDIINVAGTTILGANKLTIDVGDRTSVGATTPPDLPVSALASDLELSIDITTLSGGATETGLKVWFKGLKR